MNECIFSLCRTYRYSLKHEFDTLFNSGNIVWIGLNPSTADENSLDPTLTRIRDFSADLGYSSFTMLNLFAFRETDRKMMLKNPNPIGPDNDDTIFKVCSANDTVVCAWGADGSHLERDKAVLALLRSAGVKAMCLSTTKKGQPGHPLYLPRSSKLKSYCQTPKC